MNQTERGQEDLLTFSITRYLGLQPAPSEDHRQPVDLGRPLSTSQCLFEQESVKTRPVGVEVKPEGMVIDGQVRHLPSVTCDPFRMQTHESLVKAFDLLKACGIDTVESYVTMSKIEPEFGKVDAGEVEALRRFLETARQQGMLVDLRVGCYKCDEEKLGGLRPSQVYGDDNLHSRDLVDGNRAGLEAVFKAIKPFQRGLEKAGEKPGPLFMIHILNEEDHQQKFRHLGKLCFEGIKPVNPWSMPVHQQSKEKMEALVQMADDHGIVVPKATCPGMVGLGGMEQVKGVMPWPNDYERNPVKPLAPRIHKLVRNMRDPQKNAGIYQDMPVGISEGQGWTKMMEAFFAGASFFNFFSGISPEKLHTDGPAIAINPDLFTDMSLGQTPWNREPAKAQFRWGRWQSLGLDLPLMYFGPYRDYRGLRSPSGGLHDDQMVKAAKAAGFFKAVGQIFAQSKIQVSKQRESSPRVAIENPDIGIKGKTYWREEGQDNYFILLANHTGTTQVVPIGGLKKDGRVLNRFTPITIQPSYRGSDFESEQLHEDLAVSGVALEPGLTLETTGQIVESRTFNGEQLIILDGPAGAQGEITFKDRTGGLLETIQTPWVKSELQQPGEHSLSFTYRTNEHIVLYTRDKPVHILIKPTEDGIPWFTKAQGRDVLLTGLSMANPQNGQVEYLSRLPFEARDSGKIMTMGYLGHPEGMRVDGPFSEPFQSRVWALRTPNHPKPIDRSLLQGGAAQALHISSRNSSQQSMDLPDGPKSFGELGLDVTGARYRATFMDHGEKSRERTLSIPGASDLVKVRVNGHFIGTVSCYGVSQEVKLPAQHFRPGANLIELEAIVVGHGSFFTPRGFLLGTGLGKPGASLEGDKGLYKPVEIDGQPLRDYRIKVGEDKAWSKEVKIPEVSNKQPLSLNGRTIKYGVDFRTKDVLDFKKFHSGIELVIKGMEGRGAARAKIRLNGYPLSWLGEGCLGDRGKRFPWSWADPDAVAIPPEILNHNDGRNHLEIIFDDLSPVERRGAQISGLYLRHAHDDPYAHEGRTALRPNLFQKGSIKLS